MWLFFSLSFQLLILCHCYLPPFATGNISLCSYKHILGSDKLSYAIEKNTDGKEQSSFFVEGLAFPDVNFSGLVSLNATLLEVVSSQVRSWGRLAWKVEEIFWLYLMEALGSLQTTF